MQVILCLLKRRPSNAKKSDELLAIEPAESFRRACFGRTSGRADLIAEIAIVCGRRCGSKCKDFAMEFVRELPGNQILETPYAHALQRAQP